MKLSSFPAHLPGSLAVQTADTVCTICTTCVTHLSSSWCKVTTPELTSGLQLSAQIVSKLIAGKGRCMFHHVCL
eukprot:jgi/Bigna1/63288/fgenesh1_kg.50_\